MSACHGAQAGGESSEDPNNVPGTGLPAVVATSLELKLDQEIKDKGREPLTKYGLQVNPTDELKSEDTFRCLPTYTIFLVILTNLSVFVNAFETLHSLLH